MMDTSRKSATSCAVKCSLFFKKKLIGISIRPPALITGPLGAADVSVGVRSCHCAGRHKRHGSEREPPPQ